MGDNYAIREATVVDSNDISLLLAELGYPKSAEQVAYDIERLIAKESEVLLVYETGKTILGFLILHIWDLLHKSGPCGIITLLIITEAERGNGIGTMLVKAAAKRAEALGCIRLEVTSRSDRTDAHAFYKKAGFATLTSKRFALKITDDGY